MTDLTEFLLARIADDEELARTMAQIVGGVDRIPGLVSPARVLAECEAKRRIVEEHPHAYDLGDYCATCTPRSEATGEPYAGDGAWPCPTLRWLALPYADHPDCREEWRP